MDGEALVSLLVLAAGAALWLVPPVICLLKGKIGMGLVGLLGPLASSLLAGLAAAVFFVAFAEGPDAMGYEDLGVLLWAFLLGIAVWVAGVAGSVVVSIVGALRLAKPASSWARNYDPTKLQRSQARFA